MEYSVPRHFKVPKQGFFLFGPRGTGKSTLLRALWKDALWVDLLEPDVFRSYSARPERLRELIDANPKTRVVVIDEIQKSPGLLPMVHALIEKNKLLQFVLTGSSVRKLKRAGVDLLAGRVIKKTLHPFTAGELGERFDLEQSLKVGLVPLVVMGKDPEAVLKAYAGLYVREEVQAEGLVRNVGGFTRFLEAVSFSHASVLNISNVARECEVERKVVEGYLSILEDLLLSYRIPVFAKKAQRAVVAHPKFFFFDTGVFRSLRPSGPLDRPEEIAGAALEGLVAQHLMAWTAYQGDTASLYYWRTRAGSEVDFILYGPRIFWAIEVKNTARIRPDDLTSLKAFKDEYPQSEAYLLYRGRERLKKDGILCLSCEEFLLENLS
jgi:predicted AAA+ superfamily ATPase